ncbi:hypothetical protein ABMA28_005592 [Loxostege sticticalis]|uniref:C2H2-type domain-containing protein n=1 Tax=Loxostege sticticalis TaxID=481309 RepID=A0ABD0SM54_LOXSC
MAEEPENPSVKKLKLLRCMDWLQKQNSLDTKKLQQNKNDIQFIIQTNADRKNFLLSVAEDEATVPDGVHEPSLEPKAVPLHRLRTESLRLDCEWQGCTWHFTDYEEFHKHIRSHISNLHVIQTDESVEYVCLWDVCGHKTSEFNEMVRHINYHAYHARLMAIGFNGRATLNLVRCKKDSSKRNQLPPLMSEHTCMWVGCEEKFNCVQTFFDHVKHHIKYSERKLCSWAGCGLTFTRRGLLSMHVRAHTGERLIACFHCGQHFASNRKLADHLRRQNVYPNSSYSCSVCGVSCATEYLLREHARQHVSAYACALCDMSAPTPAALAQHVRYRHLPAAHARTHACPHCDYRAVNRSDLRKHIPTHTRKRKRIKNENVDDDLSDEENSEAEAKDPKPKKKYACHMCPEKHTKVFSRGSRLTTHLVNVHGAQWPFGHSRFRYQISEDGMYRLTTTRYEVLEVSKKIVDGYSGPKESLKTSFEFNIKQVAEATETAPRRFEITLKGDDEENSSIPMKTEKIEPPEASVEITMCDVDEEGNIISSEVINSDVVYT